jgi:hypothetical protein
VFDDRRAWFPEIGVRHGTPYSSGENRWEQCR